MAITHADSKVSGDIGTAEEWNKDHVVDDSSKPKNDTTLIVAASDSLDTTRADYVCDGIDDEVEINQALNALAAQGGRVSLLDGTYQITTSIIIPDDNVTLVGLGSNTTIQTTEDIRMIDANAKTELLIQDIKLVGSGPGNASNRAIYFNAVSGSTIINCWISNCGADGIWLQAGSSNVVSHCNIYSNVNGMRVLGLEENCMIINNNIYTNSDYGIWIYYSSNLIGFNHVYHNEKHGIYLQFAYECRVIGNKCTSNDFSDTASFDGIHVVATAGLQANRNLIEGNHCEDNDRWEINISNANCNRNVVLGNTCYGADHVGAINDAGTNSDVAHNTVL